MRWAKENETQEVERGRSIERKNDREFLVYFLFACIFSSTRPLPKNVCRQATKRRSFLFTNNELFLQLLKV